MWVPSRKWTQNENYNHLYNAVFLVFIRLEHPLVSESQQPFHKYIFITNLILPTIKIIYCT